MQLAFCAHEGSQTYGRATSGSYPSKELLVIDKENFIYINLHFLIFLVSRKLAYWLLGLELGRTTGTLHRSMSWGKLRSLP